MTQTYNTDPDFPKCVVKNGFGYVCKCDCVEDAARIAQALNLCDLPLVDDYINEAERELQDSRNEQIRLTGELLGVSAERDEARAGYHALDANWDRMHNFAVDCIREALAMPDSTIPEMCERIADLRARLLWANEAEKALRYVRAFGSQGEVDADIFGDRCDHNKSVSFFVENALRSAATELIDARLEGEGDIE